MYNRETRKKNDNNNEQIFWQSQRKLKVRKNKKHNLLCVIWYCHTLTHTHTWIGSAFSASLSHQSKAIYTNLKIARSLGVANSKRTNFVLRGDRFISFLFLLHFLVSFVWISVKIYGIYGTNIGEAFPLQTFSQFSSKGANKLAVSRKICVKLLLSNRWHNFTCPAPFYCKLSLELYINS